jgi:hypothetical protein
MYWIGELYDEILKPPQVYTGRTLVPLKTAPLLVPQSRLSDLQALIDIFNQTANISVQRYWAFQAKAVSQTRPVAYLCDYLSEQQPRLIIADTCANDIWDPQRPQSLDLLRPALTGLCERAAVSICHDLQIIDAMTRRFFDAVVDPQALPDTAAEIEQDGGVYLHRQRGLIVYALTQPGIDTLREQAPPYHRLLLAARVAHEWGHVAADGGLVALDPQQAAEHAAALRQIGELYQRIIEQAPASASVGLAQEFAGRPAGQTLGAALAHAPLQRIGDYLANLIAAELLPVAAMEAYVRANVRSLFGQPGSPVRRLARYVYEFQYLGFSRMEQPQDYFYASTWFREEYIHTKICTIDQVGRLFALMAQICACYRIDSEQFTVTVVDNN